MDTRKDILNELEDAARWLSVEDVREAVQAGNWQDAWDRMFIEAKKREQDTLARSAESVELQLKGEACGMEPAGDNWPLERYYRVVIDSNRAWQLLDRISVAKAEVEGGVGAE